MFPDFNCIRLPLCLLPVRQRGSMAWPIRTRRCGQAQHPDPSQPLGIHVAIRQVQKLADSGYMAEEKDLETI